MPDLNRLQENYGNQGLIVLALTDEQKEKVEKFANKRPFKAMAAYTDRFTWADIQTERPITFLIDKQGNVVDYFTGGYDYDFFEAKVNEYLN